VWQTGGLAQGHLTIVNSEDYCISSCEPTRTLDQLVAWLSTKNAIAFFNHPGQYETTFGHFEFSHSDKIVGMELWNRSEDYYTNDGYDHDDGGLGFFDEAIERGWYIGAGGGHDNHDRNWGTLSEWRLAVLASEKTRESIYAALQARRFFSSRDRNLALSFQCNSAQMGSRIRAGALRFHIEAIDGDGEVFSRVELLQNGKVLMTWAPGASDLDVTHEATDSEGDSFYVIVYQSGPWAAISSPIFITSSSRRLVHSPDERPVRESRTDRAQAHPEIVQPLLGLCQGEMPGANQDFVERPVPTKQPTMMLSEGLGVPVFRPFLDPDRHLGSEVVEIVVDELLPMVDLEEQLRGT
jgi:hypothetical protein